MGIPNFIASMKLVFAIFYLAPYVALGRQGNIQLIP